MNRWTLLLSGPLLLFAGSCNLLKSTSKTSNEQSEKYAVEQAQKVENLTETESEVDYLAASRDSVNQKFAVRLWPKGTIQFNLKGGFVGAFDSLLVTGSRTMLAQANSQSTVKESAKSKLNIEQKKQIGLENKQKNSNVKRFPNAIVVTVIFCLLLGAVIFVLKKKTR
jgi:hypothetical protein